MVTGMIKCRIKGLRSPSSAKNATGRPVEKDERVTLLVKLIFQGMCTRLSVTHHVLELHNCPNKALWAEGFLYIILFMCVINLLFSNNVLCALNNSRIN